MKELFREVIRINQLENALEMEAGAKKLFARINSMQMPEYFNWTAEIFEELHVKEHPENTALIWADMDSSEKKIYSYGDLAQKANQLINFFETCGVTKGENLYMMAPHLPENWFATLA
ncbi:MAG: acetyl-CoA synthetase, partial [Proteobacteria bacterium]|nr:acetyl-CoA synthetase [Pseudomonadota bacterium]